jgi:hypothetical protein
MSFRNKQRCYALFAVAVAAVVIWWTRTTDSSLPSYFGVLAVFSFFVLMVWIGTQSLKPVRYALLVLAAWAVVMSWAYAKETSLPPHLGWLALVSSVVGVVWLYTQLLKLNHQPRCWVCGSEKIADVGHAHKCLDCGALFRWSKWLGSRQLKA